MIRWSIQLAVIAWLTACASHAPAPVASPPPPAEAAPPAPPPAVEPEGIWLGTLETSGLKLRIAFHIDRALDGALPATLDSLDQHALGVPLDSITYTAGTLRLELAKLHAGFEGTLSRTAD